jgi:hypothetical protein
MAKELMEIGGFITEGAEIVNHDNTLSGNGTVDSPLGVVPGYNETVLWDGNGTGAGYNTEISLSAPTSAFETVKFYWAGENGGKATTYRINEFAISDTKAIPLDGLWQRYSDGKFNFGGCTVSANSDLTKYKIDHTYRYNLSTGVIDIGRDASNFAYIHKIVGINRKV